MVDNYRVFRYWCCKVLPLVYEDSLSYYEVLGKVVKYINDLVEQDKIFSDELDELKKELASVQNWIDNFDTKEIKKLVEQCVATMIFVEINDNGYIVYNMPDSWKDIQFNTTGLDISIPGYDYGYLVLSY